MFWFCLVIGGYFSVWWLEVVWLERQGKFIFSLYNEMIWFIGLQLVYLVIVGWVFGWVLVFFVIVVVVFGFLMLELVNYIEYYGLQCCQFDSGWYECVGLQYFWNFDYELGCIFLYELICYFDYYYKVLCKYQILRYQDESLQLFIGYLGVILLLFVFLFWFWVMDKWVVKYNQ